MKLQGTLFAPTTDGLLEGAWGLPGKDPSHPMSPRALDSGAALPAVRRWLAWWALCPIHCAA